MNRKNENRKKGWHISEEHKRKISEANRKPKSEEHRKKLSQANIGKTSPFKGKHHSASSKNKLSIAHKGKVASEKTKNKLSNLLSEINKKRWSSPKYRIRLTEAIRKKAIGRIATDETKEKFRGRWSKDKNPNWHGGRSFDEYGIEFTKELRSFIIRRDAYTCQICNIAYSRNKLVPHHVDYNKKNNNPNNLVCLCKSCHSKTNFNRNRWILYFSEKRTFLPSFSDLIDRLCISQMKEIFIPEHAEEYKKESLDISSDIDILIREKNIKLNAKITWAIIVIQLANRVIWENESKARAGGIDQDKLLKFTHSINGIRNTAKNIISQELGERVDLKIDCLAAELPKEFGNWDIFKKYYNENNTK